MGIRLGVAPKSSKMLSKLCRSFLPGVIITDLKRNTVDCLVYVMPLLDILLQLLITGNFLTLTVITCHIN